MTIIQLEVSDSYEVSEVINNLQIEETELLLTAITTLVINSNTNITSNIENALKQQLEESYKQQLKLKTGQLENKLAEANNNVELLVSAYESKLKNKTELINTLNNDLQKQQQELQKQQEQQRSLIESQYNAELNIYKNIIVDLQNKLQESIKLADERMINAEQKLTTYYQEQINNIKKSNTNIYESELKSKDVIIAELNNKLQESIKLTNECKTDIEQQLTEQIEKTKQELNDKYKTSVAVYKDKISNQLVLIEHLQKQVDTSNKTNEEISSIRNLLEPFAKFHGGTNEEKGTLGEQLILNKLRDCQEYTSAIFNETASETAAGDFHMYWGNLRCLFEIKNKKKLTTEDMEKFIRDVRDSSKSTAAINCAMFVSLQTDIYPGKAREEMQSELVDGIPVIYIFNPSIRQLRFCMCYLRNMLSLSLNNNYQTERLKAYFQQYSKTVSYYYEYFSKQLKQKKQEIRFIEKELKSLIITKDNLASDLTNIMNDICIDDSASIDDSRIDDSRIDDTVSVDEPVDNAINDSSINDTEKLDSNIEQAKQQLTNYYIKYCTENPNNIINKNVLSDHFKISNQQLLIVYGGIKRIEKQAIEQYILQIVSINTIKKLKLYKIANGCYPKRPELIKKYIPHRSLIKLNHVIRSKRVMDYLYSFIDGVNIESNKLDVASDEQDDSDDSASELDPEVTPDANVEANVEAKVDVNLFKNRRINLVKR